MSRSAIYTANTSTQAIAVDEVISPGTVIRRFGENLNLSGNGIRACGSGYYDINASFTVSPTAIGTVTVTAYKDGVIIPGATASEAAATANTPVNLSISAMFREYCPCCDDASTITFVLSGTAVNNVNTAIKIEKL